MEVRAAEVAEIDPLAQLCYETSGLEVWRDEKRLRASQRNPSCEATAR